MCRHFIFLIFLVASTFALATGNSSLAQEQTAREFQECTDCPVMVGIPAGRFVMGSPADEPGRFDTEGPQHYVCVRAFALGKYDVTSEQFLTFLQRDRLPAGALQPDPGTSVWHSPGNGLCLSA